MKYPYLLLDEELGVRFADADRIAAACGISRSYVSRLEKKALEKLREAMEQHE